MKRILTLAALTALATAAAFAEGLAVHGTAAAICGQSLWNQECLLAEPEGGFRGMIASFQGDLSLSASDPSLGSFYLNALVEGSLEGDAAPLSLAAGQCYFQVPLGGLALFAAGKKNKSIGYASVFNVSNRLTPRVQGGLGAPGTAIGLAEIDLFPVDWLAFELLGYLADDGDWGASCIAAGAKLQKGAINADVYAYLERLERPFLGYDLALQYGRWKAYAEGIVSDRGQSLSLVSDPAGRPEDDFEYADAPSLQQACGLAFDAGKLRLTAEYLFRSDGPDSTQRERLFEYVAVLGDEGLKAAAIGSFYRARGFDAHYLALLSSQKLVEGFLESEASLVLSCGKDVAGWKESLGAWADYRLSMKPAQDFSVSLFLSLSLGYGESECEAFGSSGVSGGVRCAYDFSSHRR